MYQYQQEVIMSFSNDVRNELARIMPEKECCRKAEIRALLIASGKIVIFGHNKNDIILKVETENAATARKIFKLLKAAYHLHPFVKMEKRKRFKIYRVYEVNTFLKKDDIEAFQKMNIINSNSLMINQNVSQTAIKRNCCKRSFVRGVFLTRGFINRPEGNYHLEIILNSNKLAVYIQELLAKFDLQARIVNRKNSLVLYIKESEQIVDFLRLVGASKALLDFENVRIIKSMRNNINRQVNCETANLGKTVNASVRQIELIQILIEKNVLDNLPPQLKELALLRIDYPDSTLRELGVMLDPPLSKSGVAYRMRKLENYAQELIQK